MKSLRIFLVLFFIFFILPLTVGAIYFSLHARERISFVSLNPAYRLVVHTDLLKEIMEIGPTGQPTTWNSAGDQFAARKVWVILLPGSTPKNGTGVRRENTTDFVYTFSWRVIGNNDLLLVKVNKTVQKTLIPHIQSQLFNWATLIQISKRYPAGGLTENDLTPRLGKIFLGNTQFPVEIKPRF